MSIGKKKTDESARSTSSSWSPTGRHRRTQARPDGDPAAAGRGAGLEPVPALDRVAAALRAGLRRLNDTEARAIHLAFALFLAFLAYPAFRRSPRERVPLLDWVLALVGAFCAAYLFAVLPRAGDAPRPADDRGHRGLVIGILLLLEATRRAAGLADGGAGRGVPRPTPWRPLHARPDRAQGRVAQPRLMSHQWLTTEGVFGVALGVSTGFIFLFVLFGACWTAPAPATTSSSALRLLGHLRGGPAKAAVVSSAPPASPARRSPTW
jgi:TRAP-type uncharacterized transport system fused permease subunit